MYGSLFHFFRHCLAIALSALSNVKICDRKNEDRINDHRIGCKKTIVTFSWTTKLKTKANEVTNDALASPKTHTSGGTCQRCDASSTVGGILTDLCMKINKITTTCMVTRLDARL